MSGNVLRRRPGMNHDRDRGCNRNQNDGDCKELRHKRPRLRWFRTARTKWAATQSVRRPELSQTTKSLLCFESKIGSRGLAARYRNFLSLCSQVFLPCCHRVISRGHVVDGVGAIGIGGRVRTFHYDEPSMHPGMDIALHWDDFGGLPTLLDGRRSGGLRLIPWNVAGHWIGQRVNVVRGLIAGLDLEFLVDVHRQHVRRVHTILLIEDWNGGRGFTQSARGKSL